MKFYIYCFILVEMTTIFSICITAIGLSIIKFMLPSIIPATIVFLALNILLLKHDLGKRLSLNLSYLCVLLHIGLLFLTLINPNTKPDLVAYTLRWLANISLSFVLMIMQHLKYYDKAQRNTK